MSGIAGIYRRDGAEADPSAVEAMSAAVAHRGGDGQGRVVEGPVGLAHRMLETTPEAAHETLPRAGGDLALTGDIRIDNRRELVGALDLGGGTVTDSEIVLAAYRRWGDRCPERLVGAYAFVVHDAARERLFCARDHLGLRPLYYYLAPSFVAVASEAGPLLELDDVPVRRDEVGIWDFLTATVFDEERTPYEGIRRLPRAHAMTITPDEVSYRKYWSMDPDRELRLDSDRAYDEAFREVFQEAVRCRLRSPGPVGCELSGGLDSASVACVARDLSDGPLRTFSGTFEKFPEKDERDRIRAILDQGGFDPRFFQVDGIGPLNGLDDYLDRVREPVWNIDWPLKRGTIGTAADDGVRVLLCGEMGDTTVSYGANRVAELARRGRLGAAVRNARGVARAHERPLRGILWQYGVEPNAPELLKWPVRRLTGARPPDPEGLRVCDAELDAEFDRRIGRFRRRERRRRGRYRARTHREWHRFALANGHLPAALERQEKLASMAGIERRDPFCDRRLIEFCLALPADQKLRDGRTREVLRRAMRGVVPAAVVDHQGGRAARGDLLGPGLLEHDEGRLDRVIDGGAPVHDYLDRDRLADALQHCEESRRAGTVLSFAVILNEWLQRLPEGA